MRDYSYIFKEANVISNFNDLKSYFAMTSIYAWPDIYGNDTIIKYNNGKLVSVITKINNNKYKNITIKSIKENIINKHIDSINNIVIYGKIYNNEFTAISVLYSSCGNSAEENTASKMARFSCDFLKKLGFKTVDYRIISGFDYYKLESIFENLKTKSPTYSVICTFDDFTYGKFICDVHNNSYLVKYAFGG